MDPSLLYEAALGDLLRCTRLVAPEALEAIQRVCEVRHASVARAHRQLGGVWPRACPTATAESRPNPVARYAEGCLGAGMERPRPDTLPRWAAGDAAAAAAATCKPRR